MFPVDATFVIDTLLLTAPAMPPTLATPTTSPVAYESVICPL